MKDEAFKVGDMVHVNPAPERGQPISQTIGLVVALWGADDWCACEVQYQDESDLAKISWFYTHELSHV